MPGASAQDSPLFVIYSTQLFYAVRKSDYALELYHEVALIRNDEEGKGGEDDILTSKRCSSLVGQHKSQVLLGGSPMNAPTQKTGGIRRCCKS